MQQAEADIADGEGVALFLLEQPVAETAKRLCGKHAKKRFHVPDETYSEEELLAAFDNLDSSRAYLYDHFGSKDWDTIRDNIRWLAVSEGMKHFYVDHLTALVSHEDDERRALERITAVMAKHFKGSRAIIYWAHFMFGLERDTQAEDEELRQVTTFRVLKDRYTGKATGLTFYLGYETETGILYEQPEDWTPPNSDTGSSFKAEHNNDF